MKQPFNWFFKNNNRRVLLVFTIAFLLVEVFSAFEPEMHPISHRLQIHIPVWLAISDIGIVGICLMITAHNRPLEQDKYVLSILIPALLILRPSINVLLNSHVVWVSGVGVIFLLGSTFYWAIVTILRPFLNSRKKEPFPEIKGTYYAREGETWTDEFEHLKVKEELEYELSQEFPDFWSASSHFTKRKKLELLERAAAKFHEKYGRREMALIVKELKERIESA